jgi:hypothetical protein
MRELEMRRRVEAFLTRRMRVMLAPALGLGLAVANSGCKKETAVPLYGAAMPDAALVQDSATDQGRLSDSNVPPPRLDAGEIGADTAPPSKSDASVGPFADASERRDARIVDVPGEVDVSTRDTATTSDAQPDAVVDTRRADVGGPTDVLITKYIAPLPDAGIIIAPDYMAQLPDAGPVVRYMALLPDAGKSDLNTSVEVYSVPLPG